MRWVLAASLAAATALGWAFPVYREGPPTGHTGGFGEPVCTACHFGAPLNDDAGALTLGAPANIRPGETYELEIALTHPELAAAGFQLAVRFADGPGKGRQAGTLDGVGTRTVVTVDTASGVQYGHQTAAGSGPTHPREARWVVRWTAPDTAADIVIHVAGNAANDDASEFGDFIYVDSLRVRQAR